LDEAQAAALRTHLIQEIEKTSTAWYSTAQLWDDGVIDPRQTREILGLCLSIVYQNLIQPSNQYGVFRH